MLERDRSHWSFRHREELLLRHATTVLSQQAFRINFYSGRIRCEGVTVHIGVGLCDSTAVHLKLHSIAVGILVVKR